MKGHLAGLKDAAHLAYRTHIRPVGPVATPAPALFAPIAASPTLAEPTPAGSGPTQPSPGPSTGGTSPQNPQRPPDPHPAPEAPVQGPTPLDGVHAFTLPAPGQVGPLLPDTGPILAPTPPTQNPQGGLAVPLEPFIAGSLALMVNGFVLRGSGDAKLTPAEVTESGFPKAAEACVRHYFPDLPLDHPLVALFVSSTGLASAILAKKAPKPKEPQPDREEPERPDSPTLPKAQSKGTGDAYWDAILAQAGGPRLGGESGDD